MFSSSFEAKCVGCLHSDVPELMPKVCEPELPFVVEEAGCWISGTIDVLTESGVIIDYKTGAHRSGDQRRYESQLQLYARAIETLTGKSPSAGWLYYVESGAMESIALR